MSEERVRKLEEAVRRLSSPPAESVVWLDKGEVRVPPVRIRSKLSPEQLEEFRRSIREEGVKVPLVVFHDGSAYWLADGEWRLREAGPKVPALVRRGTMEDAIAFSGIASLRGRTDPMSLVEVYRHFKGKGWTDDGISRRLSIPRSTLSKVKAISEDERALEALKSGRARSVDAAYRMSHNFRSKIMRGEEVPVAGCIICGSLTRRRNPMCDACEEYVSKVGEVFREADNGERVRERGGSILEALWRNARFRKS